MSKEGKLGKEVFSLRLGSDLTGEGMVAAHWMAEKCTGMPSSEVAQSQ